MKKKKNILFFSLKCEVLADSVLSLSVWLSASVWLKDACSASVRWWLLFVFIITIIPFSRSSMRKEYESDKRMKKKTLKQIVNTYGLPRVFARFDAVSCWTVCIISVFYILFLLELFFLAYFDQNVTFSVFFWCQIIVSIVVIVVPVEIYIIICILLIFVLWCKKKVNFNMTKSNDWAKTNVNGPNDKAIQRERWMFEEKRERK